MNAHFRFSERRHYPKRRHTTHQTVSQCLQQIEPALPGLVAAFVVG